MSENNYQKIESDINVADLYPDLSPEEQQSVEYRMLRYLAMVKEIFEEICESKPEVLTELERRAMLRKKRNNSR